MTTFLEILMEADALVLANYPGAQFFEAYAPVKEGATRPEEIKTWRFVFDVPPGSPECPETLSSHTTAVLWYGRGSFGKINHICEMFCGDRVIPLPIKMDVGEAITLLQKAGYTDPFTSVVLRWPLTPGNNEPYYIFEMQGSFTFVGVYDGKVNPQIK